MFHTQSGNSRDARKFVSWNIVNVLEWGPGPNGIESTFVAGSAGDSNAISAGLEYANWPPIFSKIPDPHETNVNERAMETISGIVAQSMRQIDKAGFPLRILSGTTRTFSMRFAHWSIPM